MTIVMNIAATNSVAPNTNIMTCKGRYCSPMARQDDFQVSSRLSRRERLRDEDRLSRDSSGIPSLRYQYIK